MGKRFIGFVIGALIAFVVAVGIFWMTVKFAPETFPERAPLRSENGLILSTPENGLRIVPPFQSSVEFVREKMVNNFSE